MQPLHRPVWIPWMLAAVCLATALVLGVLYASEKTRRIAAEKQCTVSASADADQLLAQSLQALYRKTVSR